MKTYAEKRSEKKFDWFKALKDDTLTYESIRHKELIKLASSWVTCACGNQCSVIPRSEAGVPHDSELYSLGCKFYTNILKFDLDEAISVLKQIEKRSAKIINKIRKELDD